MKTYTKQDFHNPENLTREQVGEQHRLLLPEEVDGRFFDTNEIFFDLVYWARGTGSNFFITYRVPLATPLPDGTVLTSNECCFRDYSDKQFDFPLHQLTGKKPDRKEDDGFKTGYPDGYTWVRVPDTNEIYKRKRIYVAGGMTGYDDYNFPTFYAASESLERQGWEAVNPAQLDVDAGYTLERLKQLTPEEFQEFLRGAIKRDLEALETCDAIALLPGWESSKGARAEKAVAEWRGLEVYTLHPGDEDNQGERMQWILLGCVGPEGTPGELGPIDTGYSDHIIPRLQPNDPKGAAGAKKPPMHLLPPDALIETAKAMGYGAAKYSPWNFIATKVCASAYIGAIGRHWCEWSKSRDTDADSGLSHLAHIAANCFILLTAMQQETLVDDRPKLK